MAERGREQIPLCLAIRQAREERGLTTAGLAEGAGVGRVRLEAIEAGRLTPAYEVLLALAGGLCIEPGVLVSCAGYLDTSAVGVEFGWRLRELRAQRGVSQEELARRTGINRVSIGTCERGGSDPRLTTVLRLAHGLDVPPEALVQGLAGTGGEA